MPLLIRRALFYFFVILFVAVGTVLVLYTMGWHVDLRSCDLTRFLECPIRKTGAIFIETIPRGVYITVDGVNHDDTSSIIQSGTFIANLAPGGHRLRIEKDGYEPWEKTLTIISGRVAEALNVILVPGELTARPEPFASLRGETIEAINNRGDKFIIGNEASRTFYLYDSASPQTVLNLSITAKNLGYENIKKTAFNPTDDASIIVEASSSLALINLRRRESSLLASNPIAWDLSDGELYFATRANPLIINSFNFFTEALTPVQAIGRAAGASALSEIRDAGAFRAYVTDKGDLFVSRGGGITRIAEGIRSFSFSPDQKKLAYLRDNALHIYFLEDWFKGIKKKAGEEIVIDGKNGIQNFMWHNDSAHLFALYGVAPRSETELLEVDDREPQNRYSLAKDISNANYHAPSGNLFFIKNSRLFSVAI